MKMFIDFLKDGSEGELVDLYTIPICVILFYIINHKFFHNDIYKVTDNAVGFSFVIMMIIKFVRFKKNYKY